eukprot:5375730-Amphidinium_carterae.1
MIKPQPGTRHFATHHMCKQNCCQILSPSPQSMAWLSLGYARFLCMTTRAITSLCSTCLRNTKGQGRLSVLFFDPRFSSAKWGAHSAIRLPR